MARRIADETDDFLTRAILLSKLGLPSSEARAFTRMGLRSLQLGLVLEEPQSILDSIVYLRQFGSNASAAIPTLKKLSNHPVPAVRDAAEIAVERLSRQAERADEP